MNKIIPILSISIILGVLLISGCIDNTKSNSTWGEKKLSLDTLKISNSTVGNRSEQNDSIYYVSGYISNKNSFEALNPKIQITTYYANGTVFAVNDTPYLDPQNIPGTGKSYFYARFEDPNKQISRFEVKILSAKGQY
jgi:capsule polysaccharide export protein KpsE/RkpR